MELRCNDLWAAIDRLADQHGLTASGLSRLAGLDATTFNKSKRQIEGRERWPSTQSIALVLKALDVSFIEFAALAESATREFTPVPTPTRTHPRRLAKV